MFSEYVKFRAGLKLYERSLRTKYKEMEKLTVMQEMRYNLLERTNYDLKAAKECLDFIAGDSSEIVKDWLANRPILPAEELPDTSIAYNKPQSLPDGTYVITTSGEAIPYYGCDDINERQSYKGVGIVEGQKSLIVSLQDAYDGDTELTTKECGTLLIKDFHDAVADWGGEANTKDLGKRLHGNIKLEEGEFIPSLGQMYFIVQHFKEINAAIEAVGGSPIHKDWYWTSTQSSSTFAWFLGLSYGGAGYDTKATYSHRVRPVSAF